MMEMLSAPGKTYYDRNFYVAQQDYSRQSAAAVVPFLLELLAPRSVADVGCGVGTWLAEFRRLGIEEIFGLDGAYVDRTMLHIPADRFRTVDLSRPKDVAADVIPSGGVDLAMSLEVAEHLPEAAADGFVDLLTSLAPTVVFSAAIPGQGGVNHINEQWPDYWISRFARRNYQVIDCLRPPFWNNQQVQLCYRQNMFLFTSDESLRRRLAEAGHDRNWPTGIVHREFVTEVTGRPLALRRLLQALPGALLSSLKARVGGD